jgi:cytochrome c-type protein NapC
VLAQREWKRVKANDSQECRNCHKIEAYDFDLQDKRAGEVHKLWRDLEETKKKQFTCIDCHKGIAHQMPEGIEGIGQDEVIARLKSVAQVAPPPVQETNPSTEADQPDSGTPPE